MTYTWAVAIVFTATTVAMLVVLRNMVHLIYANDAKRLSAQTTSRWITVIGAWMVSVGLCITTMAHWTDALPTITVGAIAVAAAPFLGRAKRP